MRNRQPYRSRGRTTIPRDVWRVSRSKDRSVWVRDLTARVLTIWEDARTKGKDHDWILAQREAWIFGSPHYRHLTAYERAEIGATFRACADMAYRRDLVWRLGPKDGPLPEGTDGWEKDGVPGPLSALARTPGALYGSQFWKGTDHPFGKYECTNPDRSAPAAQDAAQAAQDAAEVPTNG